METKRLYTYPSTGAEEYLYWTPSAKIRVHNGENNSHFDIDGHFTRRKANVWLKNRGFDLKVGAVRNFLSRKDGRKVCRVELA